MAANAFSLHAPRMVRNPASLLDKSTIVSIFPQRIVEEKWTISPGIFDIEAGSKEKPAVLVVGPSSWWKSIHDENSVLEIPTPSTLIAKSVVEDFCNSVDLYNEAMGPGLFWIPGRALKVDDVKKEFLAQLILAEQRQKRWYEQLIIVADMLWSKSGGNPKVVNDLAKLAARELQIKDKPWMALESQRTLTNCPYCGTLRNSSYPICANCQHVIDADKYKEMKPVKVG
jgi:hypothetical protein